MKISTDPKKIKELLERGVEEVIVRKHLEKRLTTGVKLRIKFGIDPTGPIIHLGSAIPLWKLKQFQDLGHQVVLLIGDFTARIGDTSDKNAMRKPLSEEEIAENMKTYEEQIGKVLDLSKTEIVYNSAWLDKLSHKEILKLQGLFTVAQMLERESFFERYKAGKPIGIAEFSYPLMQGYDSVAIKADVEIGGTDQKFNMLAGRTIQLAYNQEPQDIITLTLLEGTDGRKMSKSYGNIIGISDKPEEMYGKTMSMKDELIIKYFILCTRLPMGEIEEINKMLKNRKINPREAKARLAREIVTLYHDAKAAQKAEEEFDKVFRRKEFPSVMPVVKLKPGRYPILDLLVKIKLAPSKAEAKRLILQGGVKIDSAAEKNWQKEIEISKKQTIIQVGKRKFVKIVR